MASERQQREDTPLSSAGSLAGEPALLTTGAATNRATTTERRTTTTTTTKRTVKSSDDFIPLASDIQQVRSESRAGSVSSVSSPLYQAQAQAQARPQPAAAPKNWSQSSTTTTTTSTSSAGPEAGAPGAAAGLQSPLVLDTDEGRLLKLRFDVSQYEPDEIVVKTLDNRLTVQAKHEERSEHRSVYREYNREFHLPDGADVELIRSSLSKDGILTVDCPLPQPQPQGASRRIPIEKA